MIASLFLLLLIGFNLATSGYMVWYFHTTLKSLKKNLTVLQIQERRKANGIGMTEIIILMNAQMFFVNLVSGVATLCLFRHADIAPFWHYIIWMVCDVISAVTLLKMLQMKHKVAKKE